MTLKIVNLEFIGTLPGGVSTPEDRAVVIDTDRTEPHIITGVLQHVTVYRGTLAGAHAFVRESNRISPVVDDCSCSRGGSAAFCECQAAR